MTKEADESLSVYDRGFASRLEQVFAADLMHSRAITYAAWRRRGLLERAGDLISRLWDPLF